jgi:hypothetical protein
MSKPTLPLHIKTAWVEALRSGKYEQATGALYKPESDGYCCLGVLQKVLDGHIETYEDGCPYGVPSWTWCNRHKLEWRFWSVADDSVESDTASACDLVTLNDTGKTFSEIADFIEREYEGV